MKIEELTSKEVNSLPGYELISFSEVAFPIWRTNLKVQMLKEISIGVVEEFILKLTDVEPKTIEGISEVLGLEEELIKQAAVFLIRNECIKFDPQRQILGIGQKGKNVLQELKLRTPQTSVVSFCVDGVLGNFCPLESRLLPLQAIKKQGIRSIHPSKRVEVPSDQNIDFSKVDKFFRDMNSKGYGNLPQGQLIEIIEVEKVWPMFKLHRVLTFYDHITGDYQYIVYDRDNRATEYDGILTSLDKEEGLGVLPLEEIPESLIIDVGSSDQVSVLLTKSSLFDEASNNSEELSNTERKLNEISKEVSSGTLSNKTREDLLIEIAKLRGQITSLQTSTRLLRTYEHRPLLELTFKIAMSQVVIISPWLTSFAFDDSLIAMMDKALQRNVRVVILYGYPGELPPRKSADQHIVLNKLKKTQAKKHGRNLVLNDISITHEKVLICDHSFVVVGSFNWLSFKGDKLLGLRLEKSVYTENQKVINEALEDVKRFVPDVV